MPPANLQKGFLLEAPIIALLQAALDGSTHEDAEHGELAVARELPVIRDIVIKQLGNPAEYYNEEYKSLILPFINLLVAHQILEYLGASTGQFPINWYQITDAGRDLMRDYRKGWLGVAPEEKKKRLFLLKIAEDTDNPNLERYVFTSLAPLPIGTPHPRKIWGDIHKEKKLIEEFEAQGLVLRMDSHSVKEPYGGENISVRITDAGRELIKDVY